MIQFVLKPVKAPVINREGLYAVLMDREEIFRIRARNAQHGEEKIRVAIRNSDTYGKTVTCMVPVDGKGDGDGVHR